MPLEKLRFCFRGIDLLVVHPTDSLGQHQANNVSLRRR